MAFVKKLLFVVTALFGAQLHAASLVQYNLSGLLDDGGILTGTFTLDLCDSSIDASSQQVEFPVSSFNLTLSNTPILSSGSGVVTEISLIQAANPGRQELHLLVLSDDMNSNAFGFIEFSPFTNRVGTFSPIEGVFSNGFLDGGGAPNFTDVQLSFVPEPASGGLILGSVFLLLMRRRLPPSVK